MASACRRLACRVWRLAFGVRRSAFGVRRLAFGVWRSAKGRDGDATSRRDRVIVAWQFIARNWGRNRSVPLGNGMIGSVYGVL
jgi:hypothetical protein